MNVQLRKAWTRDQFLDWAEAQEGRYEFDGLQPVATTPGTINHHRVTLNTRIGLHRRLRGSGCEAFGPDVGVVTTGDAIRSPDIVITCSKTRGTDRLVPDPVVIFEVLSPSSSRIDRIVKVQEYQAIPSIRRYVIMEATSVALTVLAKQADGTWQATVLTGDDSLEIPEVGVTIPVSEVYQDVDLPEPTD